MAVELATGYIDLVPSAHDIADRIAGELDLDEVAVSAGRSAGQHLADGLLGQAKDTGGKLATALGLTALGALAIKSAETVEGANNIIIRSTGAVGRTADGLEESFRKVASGSSASLDVVATTLSQLYQRTNLQGTALEGLTKQVVTFNRISANSPITVDQLTKATAGFNVAGAQMGSVLDHLFIISQRTGVPLSELLTDVQTGGPVLRQFGFSIEQSATLLGRLNKAGIDSNQILPGLKKVFKDAADAGKDPREALQQIVTQLDGLVRAGDTIGARNLAVQVFGPRGAGLVDAALSGKLSLSDLLDQAKLTGDGILDTAGKTTTLAGTLGVLRNNATLAFAGFATPALQAANDALKDILPTVQDVSHDFAELPDGIKLGAVAAVGLAISLAKIGDFATNSLPGLVALEKQLVRVFEAKTAAEGTTLAGALDAVGLSGFIASGGLAAAAGSAGLFLAAGAGVAVVSYGIVKALDLGSESLDKFQQAGRDAARAAVDQAATTGNAYKALLDRRAQLSTQLHGFDLQLRQSGIDNANAVKDNVDAIIGALPASARPAFQALRQEYDDLGLALDKAAPKHKQQVEAQHLEELQAKATANSLDEYTNATDRGTNASSALANLTDDAKKALADLQSTLLQAAGGEIGYQQAIIARDQANQDAGNAVLRVLGAQQAYNDAVAQFGPDSDQARIAQDALNGAIKDSTSAQLDAKQASLNLAQAAISLDDNEQKLLDSVGGTTEGIDAEIAKLQESARQHPETADSIGPLLFALVNLKQKVEDVPTDHNTNVTVTGVEGVLEALGAVQAQVNTLISGPFATFAAPIGIGFSAAEGGIFDVPTSGSLGLLHGREAVLPLSDPTRSWEIIAQAGLFAPAPVPRGAGGSSPTINYFGPLDDPVKRTREIVQDLHTVAVLGGW